jgi:putative membrane protein
MMWFGSWWHGWGMVVTVVSTLMFWGLIIAGLIAVIRAARSAQAPSAASPANPKANADPEGVLAEWFARGEIDESGYRQMLAVLRQHRPVA